MLPLKCVLPSSFYFFCYIFCMPWGIYRFMPPCACGSFWAGWDLLKLTSASQFGETVRCWEELGNILLLLLKCLSRWTEILVTERKSWFDILNWPTWVNTWLWWRMLARKKKQQALLIGNSSEQADTIYPFSVSSLLELLSICDGRKACIWTNFWGASSSSGCIIYACQISVPEPFLPLTWVCL